MLLSVVYNNKVSRFVLLKLCRWNNVSGIIGDCMFVLIRMKVIDVMMLMVRVFRMY